MVLCDGNNDNRRHHLANRYADDFSKRPIISGFLQDVTLGKKRLASWPDRLTNTITLEEEAPATSPAADASGSSSSGGSRSGSGSGSGSGTSESGGGDGDGGGGGGGDGEVRAVCRPTVINCFDGDLPSQDVWFREWEKFMFATKLNAAGQRPCDLLSPIRRSK